MTDAILLLGYLDPDRFLGGRRKLSREHAQKVIDRNVAKPLGVSVEQAASLIRDEAVALMAELVANTLSEAGLNATQTAMFSFGGNGPMFGAFVSERLGIGQAYAFDFGPVFGAFGSSISDVAHVYERGIGQAWSPAGTTAIVQAAQRLYTQAVRDLAGEGFNPAAATFRYEMEFGRDDKISGACRFEIKGDPGTSFVAAANQAIGEAALVESQEPVMLLRLSARLEVGAKGLQKRTGRRERVAPSSRSMQFNGHGAQALPTHVWEQLNVGDSVIGPAMINGATMTCPVPPQWTLRVDDYGNAALSKT